MDTLAILGLCTIGSIVIILIGAILLLCLPYGKDYDDIRIISATTAQYTFSAPYYIIKYILLKL